MINARELFGDIDIYLFDQILKNQFSPNSVILDAGCGGRNIVYFLRGGCPVFGVDESDVRFLETGESKKHFFVYTKLVKRKNFAAELNHQLCPAAKDFVCRRFIF
jgi:hypothetical protein